MNFFGIAWERCFLVDGRIVIGPALHVRDVTEKQLDELIRMVLDMKLDPESREMLTRQGEELRDCVDWFISLDGKYAALRHIEYGEWKDFLREDAEIYFSKEMHTSPIREILEYCRAEIAKRPHLQLRSQNSSRVAKQFVRRVNIAKANVNSISDAIWEVESNLALLPEARFVTLVLAFLMDAKQDEHSRHITREVENSLKRILKHDRERLLEAAYPFDQMIDFRGLTLKELKRRRARGQKTLAKFLEQFPVDYHEPRYISQLLPSPEISFEHAVKEFCNQLSDDKFLEFVCAYGGFTNRNWDLRSKLIAIAVESRLRRDYE
ncbi:MAG: hypothetical protein ACK4VJ_00060 [Rhodoluna sp.]